MKAAKYILVQPCGHSSYCNVIITVHAIEFADHSSQSVRAKKAMNSGMLSQQALCLYTGGKNVPSKVQLTDPKRAKLE